LKKDSGSGKLDDFGINGEEGISHNPVDMGAVKHQLQKEKKDTSGTKEKT